jgi:steroid delta-isomerase-like uncharacterized protein
MSVEQNDVRRFCERFAALYSAHDLDGLMAMYAEDAEFQVVDQPEPLRGRTAIRQYLQAQFDAFPDVHVELGTILVDGSSFADEGLVTGTNTGALAQPSGEPLPATGKAVRLPFAEFVELADGKVRRQRLYWDQMTAMGQLGVLEPPQSASVGG